MPATFISLKVLLPFRVFLAKRDVKRMIVETPNGAYGIFPNRLDCVASLVPGILTFESESEGDLYVAVDRGIMVKSGAEVLVSVRNAIGGMDLGKLHEAVEHEFLHLNEREKNVRFMLAKLESSFIQRFRKIQNE